MRKISWKQVLTVAPLITASAAMVAAILGQNGIWGSMNMKSSDDPPQEPVSKQESSAEFVCQSLNGKLSTAVKRSQGDSPVAIIHWGLDNDYFGDKYTPESRCEIVSQRFQDIYDRDELAFITADISDWATSYGIPIICSVLQSGDTCTEGDLLLTLEDNDNPNDVLKQIIAVRNDPVSNQPVLRGDGTASTFEDGLRLYYDIRSLFSEPLF